MKKTKLLGTIVFTVLVVFSQFSFVPSNDVPQKVKDAFFKKFPTVNVLEWSQEPETEWEVEFDMDGMEYSANFLEDGTWKETEHKIKKNAIPKNIRLLIKAEFPKFRIEQAEIVENPQGVFYKLRLEKGKSEIEVVIDKNGYIVKKDIKTD